MSNYYITFSPAIHYLDKENLPTKNGIYLVFVKNIMELQMMYYMFLCI